MADWMMLLFKVLGYVGILAVLLVVAGKWLLDRITKLLDSYTAAYVQQKASIDARIDHLEKLVEEQARLTRTVEGIKDEIAAQAKSRDNRWEFRKDVYVNLIRITGELQQAYSAILIFGKDLKQTDSNRHPALLEKMQEFMNQYNAAFRKFEEYAGIAPLATADEILPVLKQFNTEAFQVFYRPGDANFEDVMQRNSKPFPP